MKIQTNNHINKSEGKPHPSFFICMLLCSITILVYWQVVNHGFIIFDDPVYVVNNDHINQGLTYEGLAWALRAEIAGNWHPLTLFSHMIDCQLYKLNPFGHHLTNLLFHIINTVLLFFIFKRMTHALWQSAFVAAIFSLHPLHVESVAWISERKDLISTLFWLLTMWSYVRYVHRPGTKRYVMVLVFFILGLMAKPMLVTLPFVLLLMDFWPLKRFHFGWSNSRHLLLEKVPLIAISIASSVITYIYQQSGGLVGSLTIFPFTLRIANASTSYFLYIKKMIWPFDLAILYPHPQFIPLWQFIGASLFLIIITSLAIKNSKSHPFFIVGWLWYMGALVPVIGLVQVGAQAYADRYMYIPLIGLSIIMAWGIPELTARLRYNKIMITAVALIFLFHLTALTFLQLRYWVNDNTLFEHSISATENNSVTHYNLGVILLNQGKTGQAFDHFRESIKIDPSFEEAHYNLGVILIKQGQVTRAINHFYTALKINPDLKEIHYHLGVALMNAGRVNEAIGQFSKALEFRPEYAEAHNNMGTALLKTGRTNEAMHHFNKALQIRPSYAKAHYNMGVIFLNRGRADEAIHHFSEVLKSQPEDVEAHNNMGVALLQKGKIDEATAHFREALRIMPNFLNAEKNLKIALSTREQ